MHVKNYVVIMSGAAARTLKKSKKRIKKYNKKGNLQMELSEIY